jgi:hypothetical protein
MKKYIALILLAVAPLTSACDKKAEPEAETTTEEAKPEEAKPEEAKPEEAKPEEAKPEEGTEVAAVEVSKEGTKFDPPIKAEQLPEGAWYCDMGTVHYARTEEGDGKCAVCGMKLKQYSAGDSGGEGDEEAKEPAE